MAHGFLSYQDTRGEVDYLGGIINAVKKYLDKRDEKEQVADMVAAKINVEDKETAALEAGKSAPRLPVGAQKMLTGGSYSKLVGRNPKALPGAVATNPQVRGGAITRMGFGGRRLKSEGFVGDQIIDVSATPVNDSNQIVQAIDRLTFVSMNLLAATKEQTAIAQRQQLFFEKLARKDKAALEEAELERRRTVSGNSPYKRLKSLPPGGGRGGRGGGGFSGGFLDTAQTVVKSAPQATKTARAVGPAARAAGAAMKSAASNAGGAIVKAGKFLPDIGKLAQNSAKFLGTKVSSMRELLKGSAKGAGKGIVRGGAAHASINAMLDMAEAGFLDGPRNIDNMAQMLRGYGSDIDKQASRVLGGLADDADFLKIMQAGGYDIGGSSDEVIDVLARPVGQAGDLAQKIPAEELPKLAAMRTASLDNAGVKAAEIATDQIVKKGTKEGLRRGGALSRMMVKQFGAAGTKSILKKIPVVAGVAGILFGIQRAMEGDFFGAGLEITSGILGATGVGAPLGLAIDGFLLGRDLGMVPMAKGGILTRPTPVVAGEAGAEGFFPLEGSRGKKTFAMFGNAFVDAQKSRIREVAQIQSAGLEEFARKKDSGFFSWLFGGGGNNGNPSSPPNTGNGKAWWDPLGLFTGRNNSNGVQPRAPMVGPPPPLPPITGTDSVSMARSLIVDKEGFAETPYWDVNAYRAGYGSDTYTTADGTVKRVQKGVNITRADADRDIDRRISTEFMPEARRAVGPDIWDKLPAAAQAALTSIAYNYGSVPGRVTRVAKSTNGNIEAIASAVEGLKGDDKGINAGRRQHEADMIRSSAGQAAASLTPPPAIGDQSSVSPAAAETGNPLSAASQQVATAAFTPQAAPIIQNFYGSEGSKNNDGNMPATVAFGISSRDTGTDPFAEFRIRSLV